MRCTLRYLTAVLGIAHVFPSQGAVALQVDWIQQFGTSAVDSSAAVTTDRQGHVLVTGMTHGDLAGTHSGEGDAFLSKYDAGGSLIWSRQFGTTMNDSGLGVATDALNNVYVAGLTEGELGGPNAGGRDHFLAKYSPTGVLQWTRQHGSSANEDTLRANVAVDMAGNVFVAGATLGTLAAPHKGDLDVYLTKYDPEGTLLWSRQFGTAELDVCTGIATDSLGHAYLTGYTLGSLASPHQGGYDAYLAKFDTSGELVWTKQFGTTGSDAASGIAIGPSDEIILAGYTFGDLGGPNAGNSDTFVRRYESDGSIAWTRQYGNSFSNPSSDVAVDSSGRIVVYGVQGSPLALRYLDSNGDEVGLLPIPVSSTSFRGGLALDPLGRAYISGRTTGLFGEQHFGSSDGFVVRVTPTHPGDVNADGVVDAADYVTLRNALDSSSFLYDHSIWRTHFGQTAPSESIAGQSGTVPEPRGVALMMLLVGCVIGRTAWQRRRTDSGHGTIQGNRRLTTFSPQLP